MRDIVLNTRVIIHFAKVGALYAYSSLYGKDVEPACVQTDETDTCKSQPVRCDLFEIQYGEATAQLVGDRRRQMRRKHR